MKKVAIATIALLLSFFSGSVSQAGYGNTDLAVAWQIIQRKQFVDLTHAFVSALGHTINVEWLLVIERVF